MISFYTLALAMLASERNMADRYAFHRLAMELIHSGNVEDPGMCEKFRCFASRLEAGDLVGATAWVEKLR